MTKRLSIVVPTALAAGALLLSACGGETTSASDSTSDTPTTTTSVTAMSTSDASGTSGAPATSPVASGAGEELDPVDCGAVTLDTGIVHQLIADPAASGIVGCTEAFNVIDAFTKLPPEKRGEASLGNVELAGGWSCTVDDGETANVSCGKEKVGEEYGFSLHTEQQG
jgi:hypothetical protein